MKIISIIGNNALTFLTGLTVIILYYYTNETYLLRKESQKQTAHLFTPYLSLRNSEDGLKLVNLGKGIAKDVVIDSSIKIEGFSVLPIPTIGPSEERFLYYPSGNGEGSWHVRARLVPDQFSLTYKDTIGNEYEARFMRHENTHGVFSVTQQTQI